MEKNKSIFSLRPHHGLCLAYFEGKGYSDAFTENMQRMLETLTKAEVRIRLVTETDEICAACPHNEQGVCTEDKRVRGFDQRVLQFCGLSSGQILLFHDFTSKVQNNILSADRLSQVCAGCQWEDICRNGTSRWQ